MKQQKWICILFIMAGIVSSNSIIEARIMDPLTEIKAVRTTENIKIDGILSEAIWSGVGYTNLIQRNPVEGANPSEKTEVYIAYNDLGLYVAGKCYHTGTDSIAGGIARRDKHVDSDWFWFWIDANNDHQTAFGFAVNPAGSKIDQKMYQDILSEDDWNGIWESAAHCEGNKWTFEMHIPYSQLRFTRQEEYVWGCNFKRYIIKNAEDDWFVMTPKKENGFVSRFGKLTGIKGIAPPSRLFISPFVSGKSSYNPATRGEAFYDKERWGANLGLDIKYGLTGDLTLDLAVNPDFGQAEVDPARMNLSAYETYYSEKREFFIEGADIFSFGSNPAGGVWQCYWNTPQLFYSRRIGRKTTGNVTHQGQVHRTETATILGAAKVSGKIGNWSVGSINAVTQREYAEIDSAGNRFKEPIEPLTSYNIFRGMREFNQGDQGLGFIFTNVTRKMDENNLMNVNNSKSFVGGIDGWTFFGKERAWAFMGKMAYSNIQGSEQRLTAIQRSSTHYFQRPDLKAASLDSTRTMLSGFMGRLGIKKMRGNFNIQAALGIVSPGFNINDAGYLSYGNVINMHIVGTYRWLEPKSWYRRIILSVMTSRNFDFDKNPLFKQNWASFAIALPNYWVFNTNIQFTPDALNPSLTRGGPMKAYPGYTQIGMNLTTDSRKPVQAGLTFYGQSIDDGGYYRGLSANLIYKPSASVRLTLSGTRNKSLNHHQWVANIKDAAADYGAHYVFSSLEYNVNSMTLSADWGITPKLSLQAYFQPYFAVGHYYDFKEQAEAKTYNYNAYDFKSNPDFNYKSFKANVVLRWEYQPGSLFYLVWTQNRNNFANPGEFRFGRDMNSLFNEWSDNVVFMKLTYMFKK